VDKVEKEELKKWLLLLRASEAQWVVGSSWPRWTKAVAVAAGRSCSCKAMDWPCLRWRLEASLLGAEEWGLRATLASWAEASLAGE